MIRRSRVRRHRSCCTSNGTVPPAHAPSTIYPERQSTRGGCAQERRAHGAPRGARRRVAARRGARPRRSRRRVGRGGEAAATPGPLIRVPVGTEVRATLRNTLDKPLTVFGFGKTRGIGDSVVVPPTRRATCNSRRRRPARTTTPAQRGSQVFGLRLEHDMQLVGAIVVDPPNAPRSRAIASS